jgi:hypothetical protein
MWMCEPVERTSGQTSRVPGGAGRTTLQLEPHLAGRRQGIHPARPDAETQSGKTFPTHPSSKEPLPSRIAP